MAGVGEEHGRVHEPPGCAFGCCEEDVGEQAYEGDSAASVVFGQDFGET